MRLARVFIILVALIACAWFVFGIRQARDTSNATSLISKSGTLTAAQSARAASLLDSAGVLNPDAEVDVLRARLALDERIPGRAMRIVEDVVRREPQNIEAWFVLASASGRQPKTLLRALEQIARLEPRITRNR